MRMINLQLRPTLFLVGALALSSAVLSVALAVSALRPRPIVIVPGAENRQVIVPEQIPDAAVKKFGLLYLSYFDAYTPTTIEERSNYVLRLVAPEQLEAVVKSLSERATYVVQARESSTLVLPLPEACGVASVANGLTRFSTVAERRILIAGSLKSVEQVEYVLDLRSALPSEFDPYGLVVVRQSIRSRGQVQVENDRR